MTNEVKRMTMDELHYLQAMVEISYRPKIMTSKVLNDVLSNLSLVAIFASQILVLMLYIRFEMYMLIVYLGGFIGSIYTFISTKRLKKKILKFLEMMQEIENAKDPNDLGKIDLGKYGLEVQP